MQDDQRTACGVGIAVELVELAPAAVVALRLEQFLRGGLQFLAWGARLAERPQAEDAVLGVFGRRLEQPGADGLDALGDALLLLRGAPFAHAAQRDVGRGERAGLRRRAVAGRAPVVEILVVEQEILDHGLSRVVGLPAAQFQGEQRVAGRVYLAALALTFLVFGAVAVEEGGDVIELFLEVIGLDGETVALGRGQGQHRNRLVVASEASALGDVPLGPLEH